MKFWSYLSHPETSQKDNARKKILPPFLNVKHGKISIKDNPKANGMMFLRDNNLVLVCSSLTCRNLCGGGRKW